HRAALDARAREHVGQESCAGDLVAGRVRGVDREVGAQQIDGLGADGGEVEHGAGTVLPGTLGRGAAARWGPRRGGGRTLRTRQAWPAPAPPAPRLPPLPPPSARPGRSRRAWPRAPPRRWPASARPPPLRAARSGRPPPAAGASPAWHARASPPPRGRAGGWRGWRGTRAARSPARPA